LKRTKAQSIIEYSIVLGLVAGLFIVMQFYLKRGIQAGIKITADQLGTQDDGYSFSDPKEGSVDTGTTETRTPQPSLKKKTVSAGGEQVVYTQQATESTSHIISKRRDDGWYNIGDTSYRKD
jgi:hypothetical protein